MLTVQRQCTQCTDWITLKQERSETCSAACAGTKYRAIKRFGNADSKECRTCRRVRSRVLDFDGVELNCFECSDLQARSMKWCPECSTAKSLDDFYWKYCKRARRRAPDATCKSCAAVRAQEWHSRPEVKERARAQHMQARYGLSPNAFEDLLRSQGGRCAICKVRRSEASSEFHVDHDHACCPTERSCGSCVRGILCFSCNVALGALRDSVEAAESLVQYLRSCV